MNAVSISFLDGVLYSILGMIVVFFALFLLMCIIKLMWLFEKKEKGEGAPAAPAAAPAAPIPAPGSAGEFALYDTDERDAAMIMAIVADELGIPVNELRFKYIREVKD